MRIKLVFDNWQRNGESVGNTSETIHLTEGDFHSGSTFMANIILTLDQRLELLAALAAGYTPVFWIDIDREGV